jgi:hypothetical protein
VLGEQVGVESCPVRRRGEFQLVLENLTGRERLGVLDPVEDADG